MIILETLIVCDAAKERSFHLLGLGTWKYLDMVLVSSQLRFALKMNHDSAMIGTLNLQKAGIQEQWTNKSGTSWLQLRPILHPLQGPTAMAHAVIKS